ncbi:ankyrin [Fragilariopsis cylindrus CCMP1102]|uniref:Ankyrin n=1 Tax=Fragilariopsis cylindrus CCMP1102 TaxID=635003 RepID=A0A1E7F9U9_9STRA|nr:ankyrin [Fragilariopsis cylindrus CCMP1102]|eukprot:OEU14952.1 ankyrin [Fragilariopsis cylindrus CCMP1102]
MFHYYDCSELLFRAVKDANFEEVNRLLSIASAATGTIFDIVNEEDDNGMTPLIEACISGDERIVRLLLDSGAKSQLWCAKHTPLRGAAICGHHHIIPILLNAGANPNLVSEGNRTPLMGACFLRENVPKEKRALCVKALFDCYPLDLDPTRRNSFGESALDLARIRGYEESIQILEKAMDRVA